jgi:hypothetical protein
MIVRPLPGVRPNDLASAFQEVLRELTNASVASDDVYKSYVRWANRAAQRLGNVVTSSEVDRLVLTRRYWALQSVVDPRGLAAIILANAEFDERRRMLEETHRVLKEEIGRWSVHGMLVMPDTSFYIEHVDKLEDADFGDVVKHWDHPIRVVVPILVVDELDRLKETRDKHVRWRASHTLAVLNKRLADPARRALLRPKDDSAIASGGFPRGEVTIEVVFDPPGHVRLPISDDEIIDRAFALQTFAGRSVTMVTYDTGQAMRARAMGLDAMKLDRPREPDDSGKGAR